jgi:hypothetical protein
LEMQGRVFINFIYNWDYGGWMRGSGGLCGDLWQAGDQMRVFDLAVLTSRVSTSSCDGDRDLELRQPVAPVSLRRAPDAS